MPGHSLEDQFILLGADPGSGNRPRQVQPHLVEDRPPLLLWQHISGIANEPEAGSVDPTTSS